MCVSGEEEEGKRLPIKAVKLRNTPKLIALHQSSGNDQPANQNELEARSHFR